MRPGEIVFCVYDRESTNEPNRLVAASVGVAIPADQEQYGYLSEHHSFGETEEKAGEYAEDLAASMLATTLGIEFDPDTAWDERENLFKMSGKIVRTSNITQSAIGNKDGLWTTVFAACAFVNEDSEVKSISRLPHQSRRWVTTGRLFLFRSVLKLIQSVRAILRCKGHGSLPLSQRPTSELL